MKTFLQYITEAGIRRKLRVAQATETQAIAASLDPMASPGKKLAAARRARGARLDVQREQNKRTDRVLRRAKAEAEESTPLPETGGINAHVERLERVGEKAAGYAGQMADAEKPGFIQARERRSLGKKLAAKNKPNTEPQKQQIKDMFKGGEYNPAANPHREMLDFFRTL